MRRKVAAGGGGGAGSGGPADTPNKENGGAGESCVEDSSCSEGHVDGRERLGEERVRNKARVKRSPLSCLNSHTQSSKADVRDGRLGTSRERHTTVGLSSVGPSRQGTPLQPAAAAAACHHGDASVASNNGVGVQPLVSSAGTTTHDPHTRAVSLPSWTCSREHGCGQKVCSEALGPTLVRQDSKTADSNRVKSSREQLHPIQPSSSTSDLLAEVLQQQGDEVTLSVDDVIVSSCDTNDLLAELSYCEKL